MYGTKNVKQLTIQEILKSITEYDIFKYYIGKNFKIGTIKSPLRKDSRASFDIFKSPNTVRKILFKDHGTGDKGSCFDLVMCMYRLSFMEALKCIDNDFKLGLNNKPFSKKGLTKGYIGKASGVDVDKIESSCLIRVKRRKWNATTDKRFWGSYGITGTQLLKFNVSPLEALKINNKWFKFKKDECIYCYHFGDYIYKIYQPYSEDFKWLSNASADIIQGWEQIPQKGNIIVITKSLKDILVLDSIEVPAIAPQSEGTIPSQEIISELKERFEIVISNYDYDRRGIVSANRMRKIYNITPFMFTPEFKVKDVSDYVKKYGINSLKTLKNEVYKQFHTNGVIYTR
jgi:hypothetical protein